MIPSMLESIQTRFRQVFYLDLRMLACFRIGLGALTLWDLGCRAGSFKAHYGSSGVLPPNEASLYADFNTLIPFHLWFTSDIQQACLFYARAGCNSAYIGNQNKVDNDHLLAAFKFIAHPKSSGSLWSRQTACRFVFLGHVPATWRSMVL